MRLHSISLRNFKSFGDGDGAGVEMPLARISYLIGPNGAGKSNVLEGLESIAVVLGGSTYTPDYTDYFDDDDGRPMVLGATVELSDKSYAKMAYRRPVHKWDAQAQVAPPRAPDDTDAGDIRDAPTVVLAMEEPELYQHPTRMRHLASLLRSLPDEGHAGAPGPVQAVYTTHSPHFVFADRMGQIRLVRTRYGRPMDPGTTAVVSATPSDILEDLRRCGATAESEGVAVDYFLLNAMGPAVNEGFFARAVVLVEGPSDRIVIEAAAAAMGMPLD